MNFTLEELAVTSPAYNYFLGRIEELEMKEQRLRARKLSTEFPKYLQYERVKQLVNGDVLFRLLSFTLVFNGSFVRVPGRRLREEGKKRGRK